MLASAWRGRCAKFHGSKVVISKSSFLISFIFHHYGLQTADLPSDLVIDHALANSLVRERVKVASSIIWDELSMSSKIIFEMVNRNHHLLAPEKDFWKPFGGTVTVLT